MNISYENQMNMAFDKPLEYKKVLLYPATLPYYSIFACADECLDASRIDEKDIKLLRLPYLEYMYEKSLTDENFKNKWDMLICVLGIVFGNEQPFDILRDNGQLFIKVYQRSEGYDKLNQQYEELKIKFANDYAGKEINKIELKNIAEKMQKIQDKMFNHIMINSTDFDRMRELIMMQNDIKSEHYDAKTEAFLYRMKSKLQEARKRTSDSTDLEDLITIVAYNTGRTNKELSEMTIRRFNRYLQYTLSKDDYYMYKQLELCGMIKMKSELPHWIRHYEPKGRFDDILVNGNDMLSSLKDGDTI